MSPTDPLILEQCLMIELLSFPRRHGSCYEIKQGKKKILIRVPSPGSRARINRARHEIIEISLIQKNAISQRLNGVTSLNTFYLNILNKRSENLHE